MPTKRPASDTPQAEGDPELQDAEQEQVTEIAMTKQEHVEKISDRAGLTRDATDR